MGVAQLLYSASTSATAARSMWRYLLVVLVILSTSSVDGVSGSSPDLIVDQGWLAVGQPNGPTTIRGGQSHYWWVRAHGAERCSSNRSSTTDRSVTVWDLAIIANTTSEIELRITDTSSGNVSASSCTFHGSGGLVLASLSHECGTYLLHVYSDRDAIYTVIGSIQQRLTMTIGSQTDQQTDSMRVPAPSLLQYVDLYVDKPGSYSFMVVLTASDPNQSLPGMYWQQGGVVEPWRRNSAMFALTEADVSRSAQGRLYAQTTFRDQCVQAPCQWHFLLINNSNNTTRSSSLYLSIVPIDSQALITPLSNLTSSVTIEGSVQRVPHLYTFSIDSVKVGVNLTLLTPSASTLPSTSSSSITDVIVLVSYVSAMDQLIHSLNSNALTVNHQWIPRWRLRLVAGSMAQSLIITPSDATWKTSQALGNDTVLSLCANLPDDGTCVEDLTPARSPWQPPMIGRYWLTLIPISVSESPMTLLFDTPNLVIEAPPEGVPTMLNLTTDQLYTGTLLPEQLVYYRYSPSLPSDFSGTTSVIASDMVLTATNVEMYVSDLSPSPGPNNEVSNLVRSNSGNTRTTVISRFERASHALHYYIALINPSNTVPINYALTVSLYARTELPPIAQLADQPLVLDHTLLPGDMRYLHTVQPYQSNAQLQLQFVLTFDTPVPSPSHYLEVYLTSCASIGRMCRSSVPVPGDRSTYTASALVVNASQLVTFPLNCYMQSSCWWTIGVRTDIHLNDTALHYTLTVASKPSNRRQSYLAPFTARNPTVNNTRVDTSVTFSSVAAADFDNYQLTIGRGDTTIRLTLISSNNQAPLTLTVTRFYYSSVPTKPMVNNVMVWQNDTTTNRDNQTSIIILPGTIDSNSNVGDERRGQFYVYVSCTQPQCNKQGPVNYSLITELIVNNTVTVLQPTPATLVLDAPINQNIPAQLSAYYRLELPQSLFQSQSQSDIYDLTLSVMSVDSINRFELGQSNNAPCTPQLFVSTHTDRPWLGDYEYSSASSSYWNSVTLSSALLAPEFDPLFNISVDFLGSTSSTPTSDIGNDIQQVQVRPGLVYGIAVLAASGVQCNISLVAHLQSRTILIINDSQVQSTVSSDRVSAGSLVVLDAVVDESAIAAAYESAARADQQLDFFSLSFSVSLTVSSMPDFSIESSPNRTRLLAPTLLSSAYLRDADTFYFPSIRTWTGLQTVNAIDGSGLPAVYGTVQHRVDDRCLNYLDQCEYHLALFFPHTITGYTLTVSNVRVQAVTETSVDALVSATAAAASIGLGSHTVDQSLWHAVHTTIPVTVIDDETGSEARTIEPGAVHYFGFSTPKQFLESAIITVATSSSSTTTGLMVYATPSSDLTGVSALVLAGGGWYSNRSSLTLQMSATATASAAADPSSVPSSPHWMMAVFSTANVSTSYRLRVVMVSGAENNYTAMGVNNLPTIQSMAPLRLNDTIAKSSTEKTYRLTLDMDAIKSAAMNGVRKSSPSTSSAIAIDLFLVAQVLGVDYSFAEIRVEAAIGVLPGDNGASNNAAAGTSEAPTEWEAHNEGATALRISLYVNGSDSDSGASNPLLVLYIRVRSLYGVPFALTITPSLVRPLQFDTFVTGTLQAGQVAAFTLQLPATQHSGVYNTSVAFTALSVSSSPLHLDLGLSSFSATATLLPFDNLAEDAVPPYSVASQLAGSTVQMVSVDEYCTLDQCVYGVILFAPQSVDNYQMIIQSVSALSDSYTGSSNGSATIGTEITTVGSDTNFRVPLTTSVNAIVLHLGLGTLPRPLRLGQLHYYVINLPILTGASSDLELRVSSDSGASLWLFASTQCSQPSLSCNQWKLTFDGTEQSVSTILLDASTLKAPVLYVSVLGMTQTQTQSQSSEYSLSVSLTDPHAVPRYLMPNIPTHRTFATSSISRTRASGSGNDPSSLHYYQLPLGDVALTNTDCSIVLVSDHPLLVLYTSFSYSQPGPNFIPTIGSEMWTMSSTNSTTSANDSNGRYVTQVTYGQLSKVTMTELPSQTILYVAVQYKRVSQSTAPTLVRYTLAANLRTRAMVRAETRKPVTLGGYGNGMGVVAGMDFVPSMSLPISIVASMPIPAPVIQYYEWTTGGSLNSGVAGVLALSGLHSPLSSLPWLYVASPVLSLLADPLVSESSTYDFSDIDRPSDINARFYLATMPTNAPLIGSEVVTWEAMVYSSETTPFELTWTPFHADDTQTGSLSLSGPASPLQFTGSLLSGTFAFYAIDLADIAESGWPLIVSVNTTNSDGNTDLFISRTETHPLPMNAQWCAVDDSNQLFDAIRIPLDTDTNKLYVSVFAQRQSSYVLQIQVSGSGNTPNTNPDSGMSDSTNRAAVVGLSVSLSVVALLVLTYASYRVYLRYHSRETKDGDDDHVPAISDQRSVPSESSVAWNDLEHSNTRTSNYAELELSHVN